MVNYILVIYHIPKIYKAQIEKVFTKKICQKYDFDVDDSVTFLQNFSKKN